MQRDRLPDDIGALRRDLVRRAERASSIRAIDLKPVVATIKRDQPEVVENRSAKRGFLIEDRASESPHRKAAENVGPQTMRAEPLRRTGLQEIDSGTTQGRIRNFDARQRFQT